MNEDAAGKELFEAKHQYHEAEKALARATARLNRAEHTCRVIFDQKMRGAEPKPALRKDWHYDSQGYCDNPGRGY